MHQFKAIITYQALLFIIPSIMVAQTNTDSNDNYYLLTGTYTSGKSEGIYLYSFDQEKGLLTHQFTAKDIENPSFVALSPDFKYIYAVNELNDKGAVSAFRFDKDAARMELLNKQFTNGGAPCYLTVSKNGKHLIAGNYTGGNLSVFSINKDGSLSKAIQTINHEGSSVNKQRQEKPHVHSTVFSPDQKHLFVGDLGTDKIYAYSYNSKSEDNPFTPADEPFTSVAPGSGPRHLVFNEKGDFVYVVLELTADIGVYRHTNGLLTHLQTISMDADDFEGEVSGAEVRISPDGKFLYASNRGDANEIVIYSINQQTGILTFVDRQSTLGKTPRNFVIDPTGNYLLVANQNSDSIIVFKRDKKTGRLNSTGHSVEVGNPVYLLIEKI